MNNWIWDGNVWDYDPEQESPCLYHSGRPILTGEIKCVSKDYAEYIVKACNLFPELVEISELISNGYLMSAQKKAKELLTRAKQ